MLKASNAFKQLLQIPGISCKPTFIISRPYKIYTPEDYKSAASYYLSLDPPDLTQAAEKIWKSAAITVKLYFLSMNFLVCSEKSMSLMTKKACNSFVGGASICDGFLDAKTFYNFYQGYHEFNPDEFETRMTNVYFFVDKFPLLDRSMVKRKIEAEFPQVLDNKTENKNKEIEVRQMIYPRNEVICCGKKYYPTHMFY